MQFDKNKVSQKSFEALHEVLLGHLIQNSVLLGQASNQNAQAFNALNVGVGVAAQLMKDFFQLSTSGEASEEFLVAISGLTRSQIKGFEIQKEQAAKEGKLLLKQEDYDFFDSLQELVDLLPEAEVEEESNVIIP